MVWERERPVPLTFGGRSVASGTEVGGFSAGSSATSGRVDAGALDRTSSTAPGDAARSSPTKPEAAPTANTSPASTTVRFQRLRGLAGGAASSAGLVIPVIPVVAAAVRRLGARCSLGSGSNRRACSASTGSTNASSGLIGPSSAFQAGTAPSGPFPSRLWSEPADIGTVLQACGSVPGVGSKTDALYRRFSPAARGSAGVIRSML